MGRLEGKVALITGATKGIGETTAELFVKEGAKVVLVGRCKEDGERIVNRLNQNDINAAFYQMDVGVYGDWEKCMAFVRERFGKLHVLVNNAGVSYRETIGEATQESWNEMLQTNQTGNFYGMKYAIEEMCRHGEKSSIINTSSIDGLAGDSVFFGYCATKAAVQAMTKCAALYCGESGFNIRVNAVAPGYILTPMAYEDARQNGQTIEEYSEAYIKLHPIGHLGTPEDVAYAYLYLASDESGFVTGSTLIVDGGYLAK